MSDPHAEHASPIKTPKQLITVVILAFIVPIAVIGLLVTYASSRMQPGSGSDAMTEAATTARIAPLATLVLADAPPAADAPPPPSPAAPALGATADPAIVAAIAAANASASGQASAPAGASATPVALATASTAGNDVGQKLFASVCTACHGAGIAGAPKFGDKAAWAPRIAKGMDTLYDHALHGFQGQAGVMPAKGGSSASDDDVKAAVRYMVSAAK